MPKGIRPKDDIYEVARDARLLGAGVVAVHSETVVEPVELGDLLTPEFTKSFALGSGISEEEAYHLLEFAPLDFLKKIGVPYTPSIRD